MEQAQAALGEEARMQERRATSLLDAKGIAQEDRMGRDSQRTSAVGGNCPITTGTVSFFRIP